MRSTVIGLAVAGALVAGGGAIAAPAIAGDADAPSDVATHHEQRVTEALDGLVADGTLTQEQVGEVATALGDEWSWPADHGWGDGPGTHLLDLATAAEALSLTEDDLREALEGGATLASVADEQGVQVDDLVDALVAAARGRLDDGVSAGMPQAWADALAGDLEERLDDVVTTSWLELEQGSSWQDAREQWDESWGGDRWHRDYWPSSQTADDASTDDSSGSTSSGD